MFYLRNYKTHNETIKELKRKQRIAEMKYEERKLKLEILKLYLPFHINIKFNKIIVLSCIAAIVIYTTAALLLQKYTMTEPSPTLTTCVYAFFGTELLGLAGIKICDTKFTNQGSNIDYSNTDSSFYDDDTAG